MSYIDVTDAVCTDADTVSSSVLVTGTTLTYVGNTFQEGDSITLSVQESSTPSGISVVYVWEFWDGSVETTAVPTVTKVLNRSGQCVWKCSAVDVMGRSSSVTGSVDVHGAPYVYSIVISENAAAVPFVSDITVYATSPSSLPLSYAWTVDGVAQSTTTKTLRLAVAAAGTYAVNCTVDDDFGGTDLAVITIFGVANQLPQVSPIGQSPTILRQGTGQTATYYVTVLDPENQGLTFVWYRGVTALSHTETTEGAQVRSTATESLAAAVAGDYLVTCAATDTKGGTTTATVPVTITANNPPVITSVTRTPAAVSAGDPISFSATATDLDLDLLNYAWSFSALSPLPAVTLSGASVIYPTVAGQSGSLTGTLTVTDALGASVSQAIPTTTVS